MISFNIKVDWPLRKCNGCYNHKTNSFCFLQKKYIKKISGSTDSDLQVESAAEAAETKTLHLNYNITKVDCVHSWPTKSIQQNFHLRNQVAPQWFNSLSCWENFPHCLLRLS